MPARSQAQRGFLAEKFGPAWMKQHHFDNPGKLPQYVDTPMKKKSAFPSLVPKAYAKGTSNVGGNWLAGAVNPAHKGYCTPMTKATCTPRRKAFAMRAKKGF